MISIRIIEWLSINRAGLKEGLGIAGVQKTVVVVAIVFVKGEKFALPERSEELKKNCLLLFQICE